MAPQVQLQRLTRHLPCPMEFKTQSPQALTLSR
jgi:hypothetical protein